MRILVLREPPPVGIALKASYANYPFIGIALRASQINLVSKALIHIAAFPFPFFPSFHFTSQPPKKKNQLERWGSEVYCNVAPFFYIMCGCSGQPIATTAWCDKHHHTLFVIIHDKPCHVRMEKTSLGFGQWMNFMLK